MLFMISLFMVLMFLPVSSSFIKAGSNPLVGSIEGTANFCQNSSSPLPGHESGKVKNRINSFSGIFSFEERKRAIVMIAGD